MLIAEELGMYFTLPSQTISSGLGGKYVGYPHRHV